MTTFDTTCTVLLPANTTFEEVSQLLKCVGDDHHLQGCDLSLDFAQVEYLVSLDLGALVGLHRKMNDLGGRLTLFNVNDHLREVLTITHLDRLFEIR